jgi:hypothetical protein
LRNKIKLTAFAVLAAGLLITPKAQAQCPTISLLGAWTFSSDGFQVGNRLPFLFLASAGTFVANANGILNITQTNAVTFSVNRDSENGKFTLNPDFCGGTLMFYGGAHPDSYDFYVKNPNEIVYVGTQPGDTVRGKATRQTAFFCPADPRQALVGTWVFSLDGFNNSNPNIFSELASAGRFVANADGTMNITETNDLGGDVFRDTANGKFQVASDCSTAVLNFYSANRVAKYDVFFTDQNNIVIVSTVQGETITGEARRFGF